MKKHLIGIISLVASIVSFGAEGEYLVKGVEFKNLNEIPQDVLIQKMSLKKGQVFSTEGLLKDYNNIKKSDYIDELAIYPQVYDGGIKLVVDVKEKKDTKELLEKQGILPASERERVDTTLVVSSLEIIGSVNVPVNEVAKKIPIKVGGYFSKNKIIKGQRELLETGMYREVIPDVYQYPEGLVVVYSVIENPIINGVQIKGNTKYTTEELKSLINIEPGKVLNLNNLRDARDKILKKYNEDGYVLAEIEDIDLTGGNDLTIVINEGTVDKVNFTKMVTKQKGQRRKATDTLLKTRDYVVEREIEIQPGEVFNINDYNETVSNLMRTGYFKNVKYETKPAPGENQGVDLVLLLEEERTATLQGAVSYGSEIGLLGMLSVKDMNWQGKGQELGVTFEKSDENYTSFSINFSDPWIKGTDRISWGWSLYKNEYENSDSVLFNETDTYGAKLNIGKGLTKNLRLGLGTKAEYITEKADKSELANYTNYDGENLLDKWGDKRSYGLFSVYPSITYDTRNSYWNPTSGWYGKYQVEVGYADTIDSGTFANTTLELRKYHRGLFKNNTFAYRAVGGVMTTTTPESQRFWVGGGSTLRGYDGGFYQGTQKITATIENRTQINDVLGFVLFSDIGRAWDYQGEDPGYLNEKRDARFPDDIGTTVGVGLRVNTPVGPLRFDFGWPVGNSEESGMKFYFNMGQSF
ncbi:MAG: BamA/OMP85 family outer membrane protein [Cetobacterium somerae]|uniref:BamA/OMP85 family outer membrane protein n=2 Tax=Fusobacteriaceae TaxID=203492 RepID=UPI00163CBA28|nr:MULTISPECIES: outer membrane protein assembly factor [Cetobacterium]MBC2853843.1 outer membrane protein assembly factor [Cetobacterium sp. 2G large]MCQ9625594.1 outer membrane protein assembly factor [Cetobacterium somerae]WVJ00304.1 outer membrane protein assembly factor [Cetobacterium somerae]